MSVATSKMLKSLKALFQLVNVPLVDAVYLEVLKSLKM